MREVAAGWISASSWLDPPHMLKPENPCTPKECVVAAVAWTLCYLLSLVPKIVLTSFNSTVFIISFRLS